MDLTGGVWTASEGISGGGWDIWIGYRKTHPKYTWATWWRRLDDAFDAAKPYKMGKIHASHDAALAAIKELREAMHYSRMTVELLVPEPGIHDLPEFGAF